MKILNLYAGIGGNSHNWDRDKHKVTHVEINEEIAEANKKLHPQDKVIQEDAINYLEQNHQVYDYIWASPPCPSHSSIRKAGAKNGQYSAKVPDMDLYGVIIFLDRIFVGDWAVENVEPYYEPLIERNLTKTSRHFIWSNHTVPEVNLSTQNIHQGNNSEWVKWLGIPELHDYSFQSVEKRKVLRNCVHPEIGEAILKSCNKKQTKLNL